MKFSNSQILLWLPLVVGAVLFFQMVPPGFSFGADSLIKALQAISLNENGGFNEDYLYFLKDSDPNYKYFPIDYPLYHIQILGKHMGPFPIFFSLQTMGLRLFLPFAALPVFSFLVLLAFLYYLKSLWGLSFRIIYFAFFCTSVPLLFLEYSENLYFVIFLVLGASLALKKRDHLFFLGLGGILIGISTFYRLETVLFFPLLWLSFWFRFSKENNLYLKLFILGAGFSLTFLVFLGMNAYLYGHILGPRYLVDQTGFQKGFSEKVYLFQALWFVGKWNDYWKPGFLGLTPLFLLPVIAYFGKRTQNWGMETKSLFEASLGFLLLAPLFSPHDGHWTWGSRYLNLCIFPFCFALEEEIKHFPSNLFGKLKPKIIFCFCLVLYSLGLVFLGIKITSFSAKVLKEVQSHLKELPEPSLKVYSSGIVALHSGLEILNNGSLLLQDVEGLNWLVALGRKETICLVQSPLLESGLPQKQGEQLLSWNDLRTEFLKRYPNAQAKSLWKGKIDTFCSQAD